MSFSRTLFHFHNIFCASSIWYICSFHSYGVFIVVPDAGASSGLSEAASVTEVLACASSEVSKGVQNSSQARPIALALDDSLFSEYHTFPKRKIFFCNTLPSLDESSERVYTQMQVFRPPGLSSPELDSPRPETPTEGEPGAQALLEEIGLVTPPARHAYSERLPNDAPEPGPVVEAPQAPEVSRRDCRD